MPEDAGSELVQSDPFDTTCPPKINCGFRWGIRFITSISDVSGKEVRNFDLQFPCHTFAYEKIIPSRKEEQCQRPAARWLRGMVRTDYQSEWYVIRHSRQPQKLRWPQSRCKRKSVPWRGVCESEGKKVERRRE